MKLTVGKKTGFVITGSLQDLIEASCLPGATYRIKEGCVRLPQNTASYKALRGLSFSHRCVNARKALKRLRSDYMERRRQIRNAARRFKLTGETDIPVPLHTVPFQHQVQAFGFASAIPEAALFMDQGTGKTLVAIAVATWRHQQEQVKRVVVICPKAVKPVWPREFEKHSKAVVSFGIDQPPEPGDGLEIWVTNYDRVKREVRRLRKWKPDMIILDESHRIKNQKSQRTKACIELGKKIKYKLILTGTPMGKCISEVWSQYKFLNPDIFGSNYSQFKSSYLVMGGYMKYQVVGYQNEEQFADKLHSIAFRVTKDECLDLPPMTYQRLYVESDARTRKIYKEMELDFYTEIDGEEVTVESEAVKQMKLRQIVGGVVKTDDETIAHVSKLKISTLSELLEDRTDKKTVVFFSFTHEIKMAKDVCKKLGIPARILQGSTPDRERNTFESWFQESPGGAVALINIQCGAEGLTLHAADLSVFYSPTFSFIGYSQARDRIYRIGQVRPTTVVFIILSDTIDNRVVDVLESNGQLIEDFLDNKRNYKLRK